MAARSDQGLAVQQVRPEAVNHCDRQSRPRPLLVCAGGKTTDEYYKICASTVDTINTNGGNAGLHPSVFKNYFQPMKGRGVEDSGKELTALTSDELKAIEEETTLNAKEAA